MEQREKLKAAIVDTFQQELQTLNPEFQAMLIDDLITTFYNRLIIVKKNKMRKVKLPEPGWLNKDMKKIFNYEICILRNGMRLTKLTSKKKKP